MKELFENVIYNKKYDLKSMLNKIAERYIENDLNNEEKKYLEDLAREHANPKNSYDSNENLIQQLFDKVEKLEQRLEDHINDPEANPIDPDEYYEYKSPTGAHDAYKKGDKVLFNGEKYICMLDNCVWDPIVYPAAWEKVS